MLATKQYLFTEKYRPTKLSELIVPKRIREKYEKGIDQHMLLHGSAGTGKTSSAWALIKEFNYPYLYINASRETGVDIVRNKITDFCSVRSVMDDETSASIKVVFLDEIDGVSESFYKALRATVEEFHKNTRFIATCNHIKKLPEAIQSRFEMINFDFTTEEESEIMKAYAARIMHVCKEESLTIDKDALVELIKRKFPDMRSILNTLQGFKSSGITKITLTDVKKFNSIYKDVYELIFNNIDPVKNYQYLASEYQHRVDDVLASLGNDFIDYIKTEESPSIKNIPQIIITVAKYQSMRNQVIDELISLLACVYELQSIVKGA